MGRMVGADVTKRVLAALAEAHPSAGAFEVAGVSIGRGFGDVVYVRVYASGTDAHAAVRGEHWRHMKKAIEGALGSERHRVMLEDRDRG